jgi:DNA gyrase subunit B
MAFANNIHTPEGGTHLTGFKTALTRTLNTYAKNNNLAKNGDETFTGDDALNKARKVDDVVVKIFIQDARHPRDRTWKPERL